MNLTSLAVAALVAASSSALSGTALAAPDVGRPAPDFTAQDAAGRPVSLAQFKGRPVILEWTNSGCPFVRHMYASQVMQGLQRKAAQDGYVWLSVISSAPSRQGYLTGAQVKALEVKTGAAPADVLLDPAGAVGHLYDARATPTMVVIDAKGVLVYMGAIDDHASADPADAKTAKNYVALAMDDLRAGRPIADPYTRAYGCSVKYSATP